MAATSVITNTELHLLNELESPDASRVALVLRTLYDSEEHTAFLEKLSGRISSHDRDIERMCNHHYHGFIDSIHDLLTVREQATRLKTEVCRVDAEVQQSTQKVIKASEELVRARKVSANICEGIEVLSACLPVLKTYSKLQTQIQEKRYYPALKTLEQLEHTYLPRVANYKFAEQMRSSISTVRQHIKRASMTEINHFLEEVRRLSPRIGELAMRQNARQQYGLDSSVTSTVDMSNGKLAGQTGHLASGNPLSKPASKPAHKPFGDDTRNPFSLESDAGGKINPFTGESTSEEEKNPFTEESNEDKTISLGGKSQRDDDSYGKSKLPDPENTTNTLTASQRNDDSYMSAEDLVDFCPVLRCLHIHTVLGDREEFYTYYRTQRQEQARLALQPPNNMHESLANYREYVQGVLGFFVVEDHLSTAAQGLVDQRYLHAVWDMAQGKVVNNIRNQTSYITDTSLMLEIKQLLMLFADTLQTYGYQVGCIHELLLEVKDHYNEVLMSKWLQVFRGIFDEDNYHPISVDTNKEYHAITQVFPYQDAALEAGPFPKQFPFSLMVPKVYRQVKNFIAACLLFSEGLALSESSKEDMVRRSTNLLLTRTLSGCLAALIKRPGLGLLQLIQITINTLHLEHANTLLEHYVARLTGSGSGGSVGGLGAIKTPAVLGNLQGKAMFKDIRGEAEEQIYAALLLKLDEFLELANYDWMLVEPRGQSSSFVADLIAFLNSTFTTFTNLPVRVAGTACMSACQHIARSLLALLLADSVKQLSLPALEQLSLDILQCEQFAAGEPVHGLEEGALVMCFADLRQLLDLFLSEDWSTYCSEHGRGDAKYLRVAPSTAAVLVEKLIEGEKRGVFSRLKRSDKKKLLETVLRQLRQITQNQYS